MALSFDPNAPRNVTLRGGPHDGDHVEVNIMVEAVTNEESGAMYKRDLDGQYRYVGNFLGRGRGMVSDGKQE